MPKLNTFKIRVETGDVGREGPVHFNINNHRVPFEDPPGGGGPGEIFESGFEIRSFAHSLTLVGPEQGNWKIKKVRMEYECENTEPYSVTLGAVELDATTELNIWQEPPLPTWDV